MKELVFLPDRDGRDEIGDAAGFVRVGTTGNALQRLSERLVAPAAEAAQTAANDAAWRSALTLALLTDAWTDCGTTLQALTIRADASPFAAWVLAAQPEARRGQPVHLLVLERDGERRLLGTADEAQGILLPAQMTDIAAVAPPQAMWFDRSNGEVNDPAPFLSEGERALVLRRMTALGINAPAARAYMTDLRNADAAETDAVCRKDEAALTRLAVRMEAVCGLQDFAAFARRDDVCQPGENPLLRCLGKTEEPADVTGGDCTYLWRGVPFARTSSELGLTGVLHPGADEALEEIRQELRVMSGSSVKWNYETGCAMQRWLDAQRTKGLLLPQARERLEASCEQLLSNGRQVQTTVTLTWPWPTSSGAACALLKEALGEEWMQVAADPFCDRLTLLTERSLGDVALNSCCACGDGVYLPPLSRKLAQAVAGGGTELGLALDAMRFRLLEDGSTEASLLLRGVGEIRLVRTYAPEECVLLEMADAPTVAVWPCLPMADWKAYNVFVRGGVEVAALENGAWVSAPRRNGMAESGLGWRTLRVSEYPGCLSLMQDGLCLGALPNMLPLYQPEKQGDVIIGVDLGSSRTTTAFAWNGEPALMEGQPLTRVLVAPADIAEDTLLRSLQPADVTPTAAILTGPGNELFTDGCAFRPADVKSLAEYDPAMLWARLKWRCGNADVRARRILLHQVMLHAALTAAAAGAEHISWRLTIADDMGDDGREAMLDTMRSLAAEVEKESGLSPADGAAAVDWAEESTALYAALRGEGSATGSCVSADFGSGSTKLHLWLLNQGKPAVGEVVFGGVQDELLCFYRQQPVKLLEDLADCGDEALLADVLALVDQFNPDYAGARQTDKLKLMLDMLLDRHCNAIGQHIVRRNAANQPTCLQSILLETEAAALFCVGLMLAQVGDNAMISHLLPEDAPVFLTGRGAWLLDTLPPVERNALQHLTHLPLRLDHPTRFITIRAAARPVQSVALGLTVTRETGSVSEAPVIRTRESFSALMQRMMIHLCTHFPAQMWRLHEGIFDWQTGTLTPAGEDSIRRAAASCYDAEENFATTVMAFIRTLRENLIMPDSLAGEDA